MVVAVGVLFWMTLALAGWAMVWPHNLDWFSREPSDYLAAVVAAWGAVLAGLTGVVLAAATLDLSTSVWVLVAVVSVAAGASVIKAGGRYMKVRAILHDPRPAGRE